MSIIIMTMMGILLPYVSLLILTQFKFNLVDLVKFCTAWLLTVLIVVLLSYLKMPEVIINLGMIIVIAVYIYIEKKNITLSIFISTISTIIVMNADHIIKPIIVFLLKLELSEMVNHFRESELLFSIGVLIAFIIVVIISYIVRHYLKDAIAVISQNDKSTLNRPIIGGALVTLFIYYINVFLNDIINPTIMLVITSAVLLGYIVFLISTIGVYIENQQSTVKMALQQEAMENLSEYTSHLENTYHEMRRFRHDYINILATIYNFATDGGNDALEKYLLEEIVPNSRRITKAHSALDQLSQIKPQELKGLLSIKLLTAHQKGVDVQIEVSNPVQHINMNIVDLCRAVGILLDNAIEACIENHGKLIFSVMTEDKGVILLFVNEIKSPPPLATIFNEGFSTKIGDRGQGLHILRELVERNKDTTSLSYWTEDKNIFFQLLIGFD